MPQQAGSASAVYRPPLWQPCSSKPQRGPRSHTRLCVAPLTNPLSKTVQAWQKLRASDCPSTVATKGNEIMKRAKLFLGLTVLGVLWVGSAGMALAASKTADLGVSASIAKNCTIATTAVGFPSYDPIVTHATAADDSTSGGITVACTKGAAIT